MSRFLTSISIALFAGVLGAQTTVYSIELTGEQESPPLATGGFGTADVTVNVATGAVSVSGSYSSMSSAVVAAHIHGISRRGQNSGVLVPLTTTGGTSGTLSGSGTLTPTQVTALRDGLMYVNVHTQMHAPGEIRGQIDSVPGSGSPNAGLIAVSGAATPGGTLMVGCPPTINRAFVLFGLALPPAAVTPLPSFLACQPGPANLAIDLNLPLGVVTGASATFTVPASLPNVHIGFQCLFVGFNPCVTLSGGARVAIR